MLTSERNRNESETMAATLFPHERQRQIIQILQDQQRITVAELSRVFAVSEPTVRKDLARLERRGVVTRTHGGAVLSSPHERELAFAVREELQRAEKERIGAAAAQLVREGYSIALDASTTSLYLARHLRGRRDLTVVTNGIRVATELAGLPGMTVFVPGGMLRAESLSLIGLWCESVLQQINIRIAFLGAMGFTLPEGLTDMNAEEAKLKQAIAEAAKHVVAIIDHTKWGHVAFSTFCPTERIGQIVTDAAAPTDMVERVRQKGIDVVIA